ncbi:C2 domain-containing protein [Colletotrichum tofieldiae]|uniref:C2 domain-containing protein n=1 Tax=Colletotrichum tofieldiae TaxID=708197 RepID=A0A161YN43_9PEZI|nr:C2 domain-containing protein [Colletotrichum tofieldiae]
MATVKSKAHPLNGMHTAGIFADPSVDGPLIGTLVAIVDRAKNLPNRKTIGKQDPYCAARLGKEAKRTTTDIRGGQTPRWDQELRFAVHDSPDYYQLKVSVFHDDKKTDLIGETWIDLRDIIVPGGGQNDIWRNLMFKGKYAGEVRMEITYYDQRPKPEKPVAKPKPVEAEPTENHYATIPRKQIKRRPLPSDPFTGEAPAAPSPDQAPTPPRTGGPRGPKEMSTPTPPAPEASLSGSRPMPKGPKQLPPVQVPTQSPLQAIEYNTSPAPMARSSQQDLVTQSPQAAPPHSAEVTPQHTPRNERYESPVSQYDDRDYSPRYSSQEIVNQAHYRQGSEPPREMLYLEDQRQAPPVEDDRPPPPPAHRSRGNSQDMVVRSAYDTPPKSANAMRQDVLRNEAHRMSFSSAAYPGRPTYRGFDSAPAVTNALPAPEDHRHEPPPPRHHSYDAHAEYRSMQPTVEDVPESPNASANAHQRRISRAPQYEEMSYGKEQNQPPPPQQSQQQQFQQQQQQQQQSMQVSHRRNSHTPQYDDQGYDQGYDQVPSPAPLNIGGRGSAGSSRQRGHSPQPTYGRGDEMSQAGRYSTSPRPEYQPRGDELVFAGRGGVSPGRYSTSPQPEYQQDYQPRGDELVLAGRGSVSPGHYSTSPQPYARGDEMARHQQVSPIATRDFAPSPMEGSPYHSHSRSQSQFTSQRSELGGTEVMAHAMPAVPASLMPGVDPTISQEVSDRIYDERRQQRRYTDQSMTTPTRGRQHSEPVGYDVNYSNQTYVPPGYNPRSSAYGAPPPDMNRGRGPSPNPMRGRGASPNPMMARGSSPNPMTARGVSPNPMMARGSSPNPMTARGVSPNPTRRGVSPQPPPQHMRSRGISPNPQTQHTIKRKSVSPAPPPSDHRRLSGVPFGPDSYDMLNPAVSTTNSDISRPDPDEKIITHDGREIDPSDHLPMDTWAPEPEPKGPKTPASASTRSRASPAGAQPLPTSGRRQLRIAGRPQSQVSPVTYGSEPYHVPGTPPNMSSGGRNRLQKKAQRMSALPSTSPAGSSPLAPISSHNYQDNGSDFTPPRLPRASTWDYPSENHAPQYGSSPGGNYGGGAPPIPAKVPLPVMSGANVDNEWALMQEMSRIDIGAGRSRRHRHY